MTRTPRGVGPARAGDGIVSAARSGTTSPFPPASPTPPPGGKPASAGAPAFPRTMRALRDALEAHGVTPQKRHGQCFLTDANAVDAIVRDAAVGPGDVVLEIGTGTGLLTHALCEAGAAVDTFDIDGRVQDIARALREWPQRVRFHRGDVLDGKHALSADVLEALERGHAAGPLRCKVVSNLPYNAATPVLLSLLALARPPDEITAMVQREMAEKLLASQGDAAYGPPSVLCALQAEGRVLRRFPAQVFWPQPQVLSALLRLVPRRAPGFPPQEERAFAEFLLGVFSRRRKVLSSALRAARPALDAQAAVRACAAAGLDPRSRPEEAGPAALLALFHETTK